MLNQEHPNFAIPSIEEKHRQDRNDPLIAKRSFRSSVIISASKNSEINTRKRSSLGMGNNLSSSSCSSEQKSSWHMLNMASLYSAVAILLNRMTLISLLCFFLPSFLSLSEYFLFSLWLKQNINSLSMKQTMKELSSAGIVIADIRIFSSMTMQSPQPITITHLSRKSMSSSRSFSKNPGRPPRTIPRSFISRDRTLTAPSSIEK